MPSVSAFVVRMRSNGELIHCLSIDTTFSFPAELRQSVHIDINLLDGAALTLESVEQFLRSALPLFEGVEKLTGTLPDGQELGVLTRRVPSDDLVARSVHWEFSPGRDAAMVGIRALSSKSDDGEAA